MKYIKYAIALIADTHVGSAFAVFPKKFTSRLYGTFKSSPLQQSIYEYFKYFFGTVCKEFNVEAVIHLGDAVEGLNRSRIGENNLLPNLEDQIDCFCQLMQEVVGDLPIYICSGSDYHDARELRAARIIAERLNAKHLGLFADINLSKVKKVINVAHAVSASFVYTAAVLDSELKFQRIVEAEGKRERIHILARGHLHKFLHIHAPTIHGILVPCWKAFEPSKVTVARSGLKLPDVGGVILAFDEQDRTIVHHFLHPDPKELLKLLKRTI